MLRGMEDNEKAKVLPIEVKKLSEVALPPFLRRGHAIGHVSHPNMQPQKAASSRRFKTGSQTAREHRPKRRNMARDDDSRVYNRYALDTSGMETQGSIGRGDWRQPSFALKAARNVSRIPAAHKEAASEGIVSAKYGRRAGQASTVMSGHGEGSGDPRILTEASWTYTDLAPRRPRPGIHG